MDKADIQSVAAALERRRPDLIGLRLSQVPELAAIRYTARKGFYRNANWAGGLAIFNVVLALAPNYSLWPLSTFASAVGVATVVYCEMKARIMTRQLNRSATEQIARDLAGWRD